LNCYRSIKTIFLVIKLKQNTIYYSIIVTKIIKNFHQKVNVLIISVVLTSKLLFGPFQALDNIDGKFYQNNNTNNQIIIEKVISNTYSTPYNTHYKPLIERTQTLENLLKSLNDEKENEMIEETINLNFDYQANIIDNNFDFKKERIDKNIAKNFHKLDFLNLNDKKFIKFLLDKSSNQFDHYKKELINTIKSAKNMNLELMNKLKLFVAIEDFRNNKTMLFLDIENFYKSTPENKQEPTLGDLEVSPGNINASSLIGIDIDYEKLWNEPTLGSLDSNSVEKSLESQLNTQKFRLLVIHFKEEGIPKQELSILVN